MTDTGQVPGEGLPENAGMVQQPGVTAPAAYTYLEPSDTAVEDEDQLLMPGQQGAWGNEMAPPAPTPAYHEPGAHEAGGRDSGAVDLSAVRTPSAPAAHPAPARRPLHLGPPTPVPSASPVRSLADRGPADAPMRPTGPATIGPEYLDTTPQQEAAPQGAAPWGAAPQAGPGAVPAEAAAPQDTATGLGTAVAEPGAGYAAVPENAEAEAGYAVNDGFPQPGVGDGPPQAAEAVAAAGQPVGQPIGDPVGQPVGDPVGQPVGGPVGEGPEVPVGAPEGAAAVPGGPAEEPQGPVAVPAPETPEPSVPAEVPVAEVPVQEAPAVPQVADAGTPVPGVPVAQGATPPDGTTLPVADGAVPPQGAVPVVPAEQHEEAVAAPGAPEAGQPVPGAEAAEPPVTVVPDGHGAEAAPVAPGPVADVAGRPQEAQPGVPAAVAAPEAQAPAAPPEAPQAPVAVPAPVDPAAHFAGPGEVAGTPESAEAMGEQSAETVVEDVSPAVTEAVPSEATTTDAARPEAADPAPAAEPVPADATPGAVPPEAVDAAAAPDPAAQTTPLAAAGQSAPVAPVEPPAEAAVPDPAAPVGAPGDDQPLTPHTDEAADGQFVHAAEPLSPAVGHVAVQPLGQFVPADGLAPVTPHLDPVPAQEPSAPAADATPEPPATGAVPVPDVPQAPVPEAPQDPRAAGSPAAPVTVPAPREGDAADAQPPAHPDAAAVPHPQDPQEQPVPEPAEPVGPAAPGYDEAEREAVLRVMRERRDIRNGFRPDPIPHEVLLRVLEAAHTAPSVGHSQPWDFVVIRSADTRRAMHELAERQRDAYAKSLPKGRAKQFKELKIEAILETPVNIVVTADPTRGGRHTLGRHTQPQMAPYSSALAVENLWLAARAEGLGVGWVSFFDEREMVRALGLPDHLEVVAYLCVGYVDEFPPEPELLQAGWSKRRPLSWVVHEETYGRRALPGEEPHDLLAETMAGIRPLDAKALGEAWERQKRMTKPSGALGMLEIISAQLSGLSRKCPPPIPEPAAVAIFAGDHGVHAQGVTHWPQEVTGQMVANFLGGGAVCNAFATQVGAEVCVIDVGVASDLPATPGLLPRKVRPGTADMTAGPALTREEVKQAIEIGIETARDLVAAGNKALLTGEMGIANTTASAALISVFTGADPAEVTGRGTGINDETLARKTEVVRRAIELHQPDPADPIGVLAAFGGLEHAAMVGLLLGGASLRTPVILDGVSAGAAALVARAIAPEVLAACIAGHRSAEPGHVAALNKLGLRPLVDLDLRLGEGTGALLALPLVQSAARAMHEVATFDSAGVTEK
ncbi:MULTISPECIES: nicotinate-nucleotide--dimethylbenzimidazole phosphoribosyltransferase [unclassified Streptomyces]|uniref:nicotinate-nucleotide--dimethylbenzimidazole phosphoribosyltransferase n=1 Tax=unclassified Streptomyces TaxID=2593676 RepID=UPI0004BE00CF|nr:MULTISPECIES: nicotinate-nucleotide--dimethylbenzimidazole phosphoribosyltransferase [unclassified Streptomyces]